MRRVSALFLHATAAGIMTWGWFSLGELLKWVADLKGGHLLFLTNQGLAAAWLYMVVSLLLDVYPSLPVVRDARRALLMISMPLAIVVSTVYWSLILSFPHLIVQRAPRGVGSMHLPLTTDLALHASPLVTLLIDFFVFQPKFSKVYVRKVAPVVVVVFAVWYASFLEYCATFNTFFPYPFLTHSPFPGRVLIYTITAGVALCCFRALNALHP